MVETALVLPIMMMVIMGSVEFGRAFMVSQLLTNAAREGTRMGIIPGSNTSDVVNEVQQLVTSTVGVNASNIQVTVTATDYTTGATLTDVSAAKKRDLIDVRVSVPYTAVSLMPVQWMANSNLIGQAAMRHE